MHLAVWGCTAREMHVRSRHAGMRGSEIWQARLSVLKIDAMWNERLDAGAMASVSHNMANMACACPSLCMCI